MTEPSGTLNPQAVADDMADDTAALHAFLATREVGCPNCTYNLRGIAGSRCPECGLSLSLQVNLTEPKLARFIVGLIGISCSAGFSLLLLIYFGVMSLIDGLPGSVAMPFFFVTSGGLLASTILLLVWLRMRPRVRRMNPAAGWAASLVCWLVPLVNLGVFIAVITP